MLLRSVTLAVAVVSASACNDEDPDPSLLPECNASEADTAMLVHGDSELRSIDMIDGATLPLIAAPQGGHILLVGARVKVARDCSFVATAALRDVATQRVLGLEQRPLLLDRGADGWARPREELAAMPNVAVCPSSAATTTIFDHEYQVELSVETRAGVQLAQLTALVTPTCSDDWCQSDCTPLPPGS